MEFGTGALKITPAHDPNDYALGLKHDLPMITVGKDRWRQRESWGSDVCP